MDERHQVGRVGYRCHRKKVPVVTVGHAFAIRAGDWASPEEYWGEFLTKAFKFHRSPGNPIDPNAIVITSSRGKFLGFLSKELGAILSPLAAEGACALFGVAGHITVEIAEDGNLSREGALYLEWLERALEEYNGGAMPANLPPCPIDPADLGVSSGSVPP